MMKWLAIFLLTLNVAYFALQMNWRMDDIASSSVVDVPALASDVPLVLLSELEKLPPLLKKNTLAPSIKPPANTSLPQFEKGSTCWVIGPFITAQERDDLGNWFSARNVAAWERQEEQETSERYWVYLSAQPSEAESQAQLQDLVSKGVEDYYLIRTGSMKNAISLGLFNTQQSVNRRLTELTSKGYKPVVLPQHKKTLVFWLDAYVGQLKQGLQPDKVFPGLPKGIAVTERDCLDIALLHADQ